MAHGVCRKWLTEFTKLAMGDKALTTPHEESPELPQLEFYGQSDDDFNRFTMTPTKTTTVVTTMTYQIDSGIAPVLESTTTTTSSEDNNTIDDMVKTYGVSDVKNVEFEFNKDSSSQNPVNPILSVGHQTPLNKSTDDTVIKPSDVLIGSDSTPTSDSSSTSTDAENTDTINKMMKTCDIMDQKDVASPSSMCSNAFSPNLQSTPSKNATGVIALKKSNDDIEAKINDSDFAKELSDALASLTYPLNRSPLKKTNRRRRRRGGKNMKTVERRINDDDVEDFPSTSSSGANCRFGQYSDIKNFEDIYGFPNTLEKPLNPRKSTPKSSRVKLRKLGRQPYQLINKDNSSDTVENLKIAPTRKLKSFAPKTSKFDHKLGLKSYVGVSLKTPALIPQLSPKDTAIELALTDCLKNLPSLSINGPVSSIGQQIPLQKVDFNFASKISVDGSFKKPAFIPKSSVVDMNTSLDYLTNLPNLSYNVASSPIGQQLPLQKVDFDFASMSNVETLFKAPAFTPKSDQMAGIRFEGLNNLPNLSNNVAYSHIGPQIPLQNVVDNSQMGMAINYDFINNLPSFPYISAFPPIGQQIVDDSYYLPDFSSQTCQFTTQKYNFDILPHILPSPPKRANSLKRRLENPNNKYVTPIKKFCE